MELYSEVKILISSCCRHCVSGIFYTSSAGPKKTLATYTQRESVVLETFSVISTRLYWSKPIVVVLGLVFVSVFVASILGLGGFDTAALLIPSLLGFFWSAIYFILLTMFPSVPPRPGKEVKLLRRIKIRFQRRMYYLLALILIILTMAILFLSLKLLGIWLAESWAK